jgi:hypothetical protein
MQSNQKPAENERKNRCPYCDEEIVSAQLPFCKPCGVSLRYCAKCRVAVAREAEVCPHCGGPLEWQ